MLKKKKQKNISDISGELFNTSSMEKKFSDLLEKPLSKKPFIFFTLFLFFISSVFIFRLYQMQIKDYQTYLKAAKNNYIKTEVLFSKRGIITDRNGKELAWNEIKQNEEFDKRKYVQNAGLSHILGFLSYPKKDKFGNYFTKEYTGKAGIEKYYNSYLNGKLGKKIIKINAQRKVVSNNSIIQPEDGKNLKLTIDWNLQKNLYDSIKEYVEEGKYVGGAGIIMDIKTGEILASASFPEFDSNIMTEKKDKQKIREYLKDKRNIFLNRAFLGGYTPGSIVKPFVGLLALEYNIIKPREKIKTYGKLILPNPYNPSKPSIFYDWRNQGTLDLYKAIAWSSDVYFYILGGGLHGIKNYANREGLGIKRLYQGLHNFGFGEKTEIEKFKEKSGLVPNPEWKKKVFKRNWNIGNTYFTSIGQFGFLITPLQAVVAVSALANDGKVLKPVITELGEKGQIKRVLNYKKEDFEIIKKAMRGTVLSGTTQAMNFDFVHPAAKSGTAQIHGNKRVNSWSLGFWPYENPKYAFVVMADNGPKQYLHGGASNIMKKFFLKLKEQKLDKYFK